MFWLIKQKFIALLNFTGSLAITCVSLNSEPCIVRPALIDLNPVKLYYYTFMVALDLL